MRERGVVLFGQPAARGQVRDGDGQAWAWGGPPGERPAGWSYVVFEGPSDHRRRMAEDLARVAARKATVYDDHLGIRTAAGYFLLARAPDGWYVAALATAFPEQPLPMHVFDELIGAERAIRARRLDEHELDHPAPAWRAVRRDAP